MEFGGKVDWVWDVYRWSIFNIGGQKEYDDGDDVFAIEIFHRSLECSMIHHIL